MGKANITWRIGVDQWLNDTNFEEFKRTVKKHRLPGKIAFFTNPSHVPLRLDIQLPQIAILKERIAAMQEIGYVTGINNLCTLGHLSEDVERCEPIGSRYTAVNGDIAPGCRCPSDPVWLDGYVTPLYKALAGTGADFIYADDDIRLGAHGLKLPGCFCALCMKKISDFFGVDFQGDREALIRYFEDPAEGDARKRRMLDYNRSVMAHLCSVIEKAVHSVNPKTALGFMDGARSWEGNAREECFRALTGPNRTPVLWRPGGGIYTDGKPDEVLEGANHIAYQCANIPQEVQALEAEIENFNYQKLNKSIAFNCLESEVNCAAGATGCAWNIIPSQQNDGEPSFGPRLDALCARTEFFDDIVARAGRARPRGVFDGVSRDSCIMRNKNFGRWLDPVVKWPKSFLNSDLQKLGLPAAYTEEEAELYAVGGNTVYSMTDSQIERMLRTGAYLDALALKALWDRGYGPDTGFRAAGEHERDVYEKYSSHVLNGNYAGKLRSGRMSFWYEPAVILEPLPGAETLSTYVKQIGDSTDTVASGIFVNRFGGRILVEGYYPWNMYFFESAAQRIKGIFEYLSQDRLSVFVKSCHRTAVWHRAGTVFLLNMSMDPAEHLTFRLKTGKTHLMLRDAKGPRAGAEGIPAGKGYMDFTLPEAVAPWSLLVCTPE